ncbi:MAG: hypothetical protein AAGI51_02550 [Pseudomonadota bacterium]
MFARFGGGLAAAALALALGGAEGAHAVTLNNGTVDCFDCTIGPGGGYDLQAGERYAVSNAGFVDGAGDPFDVLFEILAVGAAPGLSDPTVTPFKIVGLNRFVHYRVTTIAAGSAGAATPEGERITVQGLDTVSILDVDSDRRRDFTEVAGTTLAIGALGGELEEGGFEGLPSAPTAGFSYARLDRAAVGDEDDWRHEGNKPNDPLHTVTFLAGGGLSQFEFVWGATSPGSNGRKVRGWEMAFSASSTVVPLPAGILLVASGLGAMALVRAARRRRAE